MLAILRAILHHLFVRWPERQRQRRHLAALDDRALADLGLSRAQAEWESGRPFWR